MSHTPLQILLVEDNPGDADLIGEALEADGHSAPARLRVGGLTVARDGEEALAVLRRQGSHARALRPDLVLLDLNLPRKNGFEVLEDIKTDESLKTIPVVILTSSQAEQDVSHGYQLNANAYLVKPIGLEEFMQVVRSIEGFWFDVAALPDNYQAV
jgi:chemotaxis family two-component system response regulator Rcp1